jgi:hypothetical protein
MPVQWRTRTDARASLRRRPVATSNTTSALGAHVVGRSTIAFWRVPTDWSRWRPCLPMPFAPQTKAVSAARIASPSRPRARGCVRALATARWTARETPSVTARAASRSTAAEAPTASRLATPQRGFVSARVCMSASTATPRVSLSRPSACHAEAASARTTEKRRRSSDFRRSRM